MATLKQYLKRAFLISTLLGLSACSEVKVLISVLFTEATSLSTSSFEFDEMKSGDQLTCAILGDKTVRCIGSGQKGNLGTFNGGPAAIATPIKLLATGKGFTCFTSGDNAQLFCFGKNYKGQLGNPSVGNSIKPVPVLDVDNSNFPIADVKSLSAGEAHACAVLKSGRAVCWGDNSSGQLGNISVQGIGARSVLEGERNPKAFPNVKDISAGANSSCLIAKDDSTVFCFGERYGATRKINWIPERVDLANSIGSLNNIKQIGVGRGFGCALTRSAQVYCWGQNESNQLGILMNLKGLPKASLVQVSYPQEMPLSRVDQITVGDAHACALHRDEKTVYCWGDNRFNQLGSTSTRGNTEQVALGSNNLTLKGVKEVRAGPDRTCIISIRDELFCWGNGADGILGNPKPISVYPSRVLDSNLEALANVVHVELGQDHTCVKDSAEKLYCFGINSFGQMGFVRVSGQALQTETTPLKKVHSIDVKGSKTCVVYGDDQRVGCFGDMEFDNINKRPAKNSFILEEVKKNNIGFRAASGVAIGHKQVCVIGANQEVTCLPSDGEETTEVPVRVADVNQMPIKDIWQVRAQNNLACALSQAEGAIWCWGQERLEQGLAAKHVMMGGQAAHEVIQISLTEDQLCTIRGTERAVYCSKTGVSHQGTIEIAPLKTTEGAELKGVLSLSGGLHHFCAVTEVGKLYCWGKNESYQFGSKSPAQSLDAILVAIKNERIQKITRVTTGDKHTCITSADDPTLYCFGGSFYGGPNSPDLVDYPL
jgi:hypothetical protein